MKKFFKAVAAVALGAVMTCGFAACGGNDGPGGTDSEGNKIVKIMVHVDERSAEGKAYKQRVDAFNVAYKEQKIKASITFKARTTGVGGYESNITNKFNEGTLDDIIAFDAPNCAAYADKHILYDISEIVPAETQSKFYSTSLNTYDGKLYGLPIQESSAGIYYNKSVFDAAGVAVPNCTVENPWTFEQFEAVCKQLKDKGQTPLDLQLYNAQDEMAPYLLYPFIYAAGGEFTSADGLTATGYMNSEKTKSGFEFLKGLVEKGYTSKPEGPVGKTDFFDGNVAMFLSSGWTIPELDHSYPIKFPNRTTWGLLPYPMKEKKASATGSWSFGITNNGVTDKSAAKELLLWMTSPESSKVITDATGMIPARTDVETNYAAGSPEDVLMKQLSTTGKARPATVAYPNFSSCFCSVIYSFATQQTAATCNLTETLNSRTSELQSEMNKHSRH